MEFLVDILIALPTDLPEPRRSDLEAAEAARARELRADGALVRIWRIPGTRRNVGIWQAEDATALHALLSSLPLFPWMTISVTALAAHPAESAPA